jgi:DNA polymerase-3 subunit epsilon
LLLDKDVEKNILQKYIQTEVIKGMAPKLADMVESLPSVTGVYYIHREDGKIIYIGKSKNIRRRVNQHFTGTTNKCKKIQLEVFMVTYEETGSELIALLKESQEIKVNQPIYNRSQRKSIFQWALYTDSDAQGYINLKLQKADGRKKEITAFTTFQEGKNALFRISDKYKLCQKLTGIYNTTTHCFQYTIKECNGACMGQESPDVYNQRVMEFINNHQFENKTMVIISRGRNVNERSAVLIENGIYKGYTFYDLNYQIRNIKILKNILIPMQNNRDVRMIIQGQLRKDKHLKMMYF